MNPKILSVVLLAMVAAGAGVRCAPGALPGLSLAVGVGALRALGTPCRSAYN